MMKTAALAGLVLSLAGASGALAADAQAKAAPTAAAKPSVETTSIADLIANPATKAVLEKDMPGLLTSPHLEMVKGMSLRALAQCPQAQLDDAKLKAIQADLDKAS